MPDLLTVSAHYSSGGVDGPTVNGSIELGTEGGGGGDGSVPGIIFPADTNNDGILTNDEISAGVSFTFTAPVPPEANLGSDSMVINFPGAPPNYTIPLVVIGSYISNGLFTFPGLGFGPGVTSITVSVGYIIGGVATVPYTGTIVNGIVPEYYSTISFPDDVNNNGLLDASEMMPETTIHVYVTGEQLGLNWTVKVSDGDVNVLPAPSTSGTVTAEDVTNGYLTAYLPIDYVTIGGYGVLHIEASGLMGEDAASEILYYEQVYPSLQPYPAPVVSVNVPTASDGYTTLGTIENIDWNSANNILVTLPVNVDPDATVGLWNNDTQAFDEYGISSEDVLQGYVAIPIPPETPMDAVGYYDAGTLLCRGQGMISSLARITRYTPDTYDPVYGAETAYSVGITLASTDNLTSPNDPDEDHAIPLADMTVVGTGTAEFEFQVPLTPGTYEGLTISPVMLAGALTITPSDRVVDSTDVANGYVTFTATTSSPLQESVISIGISVPQQVSFTSYTIGTVLSQDRPVVTVLEDTDTDFTISNAEFTGTLTYRIAVTESMRNTVLDCSLIALQGNVALGSELLSVDTDAITLGYVDFIVDDLVAQPGYRILWPTIAIRKEGFILRVFNSNSEDIIDTNWGLLIEPSVQPAVDSFFGFTNTADTPYVGDLPTYVQYTGDVDTVGYGTWSNYLQDPVQMGIVVSLDPDNLLFGNLSKYEVLITDTATGDVIVRDRLRKDDNGLLYSDGSSGFWGELGATYKWYALPAGGLPIDYTVSLVTYYQYFVGMEFRLDGAPVTVVGDVTAPVGPGPLPVTFPQADIVDDKLHVTYSPIPLAGGYLTGKYWPAIGYPGQTRHSNVLVHVELPISATAGDLIWIATTAPTLTWNSIPVGTQTWLLTPDDISAGVFERVVEYTTPLVFTVFVAIGDQTTGVLTHRNQWTPVTVVDPY